MDLCEQVFDVAIIAFYKGHSVVLPFFRAGLGFNAEESEVVLGADFGSVGNIEGVAARRVVERLEEPVRLVMVARDWASWFRLSDDGVVEGLTLADGVIVARRWEISSNGEEHVVVARTVRYAFHHAFVEVLDVVGRALAAITGQGRVFHAI